MVKEVACTVYKLAYRNNLQLTNMYTGKNAGKSYPASQEKQVITFSYDGSFSGAFYAYELQFYDVFSFYHKA